MRGGGCLATQGNNCKSVALNAQTPSSLSDLSFSPPFVKGGNQHELLNEFMKHDTRSLSI